MPESRRLDQPTTIPWREAVRTALQAVKGSAVSFRLRHAYRRELADLASLAAHLEEAVLPALREASVESVLLHVRDAAGKIVLETGGDGRETRLPHTERLAALFATLDISLLQLDTRLESNQIVDAVLLLLRARPRLADAAPAKMEVFSWTPSRLAAGLVHPGGVHKFCATMRLDRARKRLEVIYSYCELFHSNIVTRLLEAHSVTQDHRALFTLAPRVGVLAFLVLVLPGALGYVAPLAAQLLTVGGALLAGGALWYAVFTIGSIRYDREYRDSLLQERVRQIESLAHFPEANPNPLFKFGLDGSVRYENPAARRLLDSLGLGENEAAAVLPPDLPARLEACAAATGEERCDEAEVTAEGRTLYYLFTRFPREAAVLVAGADITSLKRLENELRELNRDLEKRVAERTRELELTRDATILTLSSLAETRDPETGAHIERTRLYVRALARYLATLPAYAEALPEERIDLLYRCAPLHDIGKVGVPDAILLKPGRLTEEEFAIMKKHAFYGGEALRWAEERLGHSSFLGLAREIALYHHEKWDGAGYPEGLSGEAIPLSARLMALADVYDALISKRCYKPAFSHEKARGILLEGRGAHFDPAVVDAFVACEKEFVAICQKHADPMEESAPADASRENA